MIDRRHFIRGLLAAPLLALLPKLPLGQNPWRLEGPVGETLSLKTIDDLVRKAKGVRPQIPPITIDGRDYYPPLDTHNPEILEAWKRIAEEALE